MRCFDCPLQDLLDSVMLEPEACILASCAELLLYCILMHKIIAVYCWQKEEIDTVVISRQSASGESTSYKCIIMKMPSYIYSYIYTQYHMIIVGSQLIIATLSVTWQMKNLMFTTKHNSEIVFCGWACVLECPNPISRSLAFQPAILLHHAVYIHIALSMLSRSTPYLVIIYI